MFDKLDFEREYQKKAIEQFLEKLHVIERKLGMEIQVQRWKLLNGQ